MKMIVVRYTNQSEGAQHRQALNIRQSKLHQTHGHDDTVKNVPTHLKPWSQWIYRQAVFGVAISHVQWAGDKILPGSRSMGPLPEF